MRLYYSPGTIAVASGIALEESGLKYEPVRVNFAQGEQNAPSYRKVNPKGRVPALEIDSQILTETGAILDYIADRSASKNLRPQDPFAAAQMRSVMYYLASTVHVNHAHKMRGHRWADQQSSFDDMTAKVPQTMTESAQFIENDCIVGPFILGETFTIADTYLFTVAKWMPGDGVDMAPFPKLRTFVEKVGARPSVAAVRAKGILA